MTETIKEPNIELLQLTLQTIIDNPKHWKQTRWHCGSTHCFAGFAQALHMRIDFKAEWPSEDKEYITTKYYDELPNDIQDFIYNNHLNTPYEYAFAALNLDSVSTASKLFEYHNTLEDLKLMVSYIIKHKTLKGYPPVWSHI